MDLRKEIKTKGYVIVKDLFPKDLLNALRTKIMKGVEKREFGLTGASSGITIPNFLKVETLRELGLTLKTHPKLHEVLRQIFDGEDYRFCAHNDIGINRTVSWHKDKLNREYKRFELHDVFGKGKKAFEIVKVLTYLESHEEDNHGLMVIPGTQGHMDIGDRSKAIRLHPSFGDTVIFDQRISHKGQGEKVRDSSKRILVSFGFGRNNVYTDEFETGTKARQRDQFRQMMRGCGGRDLPKLKR